VALISSFGFADESKEGALIFYDRCVLCHGTAGMGEGILPLKIKEYPKTNLLTNTSLSAETIFSIVKFGSDKADALRLMPPMAEELSDGQVKAVTEFVLFLRKDNSAASAYLKKIASRAPPNKRTGEHLFSTRCVLCHGKDASGNGRMSKVIKDPPPANLLASKADLNYIKKIVEFGGEKMGRSPAMPPWGDQFSESEIESIALYIMNLRELQK